MNSSLKPIKIFLLCPIPDDQKPITGYMETKTNWIGKVLVGGISNSVEKSFFSFFLVSIFLFLCLTLEQLQIFSFFFQFFSFFFNAFLFFLANFVFLWKQVEKRFVQPRLAYEEGSWYDGQIWEKPMILLKNDRFLASQKFQPLIKKIFQNFLFLVFSDLVFLSLFLLQ